MPVWVIHAFLGMIGFSGIWILLKILSQQGLHASLLNMVFFALTAVGFVFLAKFQKISLTIPGSAWPWFIALTFVAVLGNYFWVKAYETAPNPGYSAAIITAGALAILTLFSALFLGAELTLMKGLGVALSLLGVIVLTIA